jgi:hypothetical protein
MLKLHYYKPQQMCIALLSVRKVVNDRCVVDICLRGPMGTVSAYEGDISDSDVSIYFYVNVYVVRILGCKVAVEGVGRVMSLGEMVLSNGGMGEEWERKIASAEDEMRTALGEWMKGAYTGEGNLVKDLYTFVLKQIGEIAQEVMKACTARVEEQLDRILHGILYKGFLQRYGFNQMCAFAIKE